MKILWLTPTHTQSAIGKFSQLITRDLCARGYDVQVCAMEEVGADQITHIFSGRPLCSYADLEPTYIDEEFDIVIVNFGDHYPNHAAGLEAILQNCILGIFHDNDMVNYGNGARAFGPQKDNILEKSIDGKAVTGTLAHHCDGAVAHSHFYLETLSRCDGPIQVIPLAWELPVEFQNSKNVKSTKATDPQRLDLVTFGHINANKCADRVIEAIGSQDILCASLHYQLAGAISADEKARLTQLANHLGVNLSVLGRVDDDDLHVILSQADIVSCLRHPVLEGASASAIEAMLHGSPVLVSDAGFYRELPDECVHKIDASTSIDDIAHGLEVLLANEQARHDLGRRARIYAEQHFSPASYTDKLIDLISDVRITSSYRPLIHNVANHLVQLGVTDKGPNVETIIQAIESMAPVARRPVS